MIITLNEVKSYLRIDFDDDDNDLQDLIDCAEAYLQNATNKTFDSTNKLAKLYCKALIGDWYDDRALMESRKTSEKVKFTLSSIMLQLQYTGVVESDVIE